PFVIKRALRHLWSRGSPRARRPGRRPVGSAGLVRARLGALRTVGLALPLLCGALLLGAVPVPAAQGPPGGGAAAGASAGLPASVLADFEADVQALMQTYQIVGTAVALVHG